VRERFQVAFAVLRRTTIHTFKNPAIIIPSLAFPLVFLLAFAGGLSNVRNVPGFGFAAGYTAFQFVFVFLQMAAFGGVFTGYRIAEDYESGFVRRLMLGAPRREGILLGYVLAGMVRYAFIGGLIWALALLTGMKVLGAFVDIGALILLGALVNVACTLWVAGLAFHFKSVSIGSFMQTPVFILLFLAPVYVPIGLLGGWLKQAAMVNPVTAIVEAGRGFISGQETKTTLAFACAGAVVLVMLVFAARQMRQAERGA
jgi:ABC-2 type transport system permease protein